jgi:hypothetical protein
MVASSLKPGDKFYSPGASFEYEVMGACCLLFDREELPYPCCSLEWKGKQPSWRRIGKRFIPDIASSNKEVYSVKLLGKKNLYQHYFTFTFWEMPKDLKKWWYGK